MYYRCICVHVYTVFVHCMCKTFVVVSVETMAMECPVGAACTHHVCTGWILLHPCSVNHIVCVDSTLPLYRGALNLHLMCMFIPHTCMYMYYVYMYSIYMYMYVLYVHM